MELNELIEILNEEKLGQSTASVVHFMDDIKKKLKGKKSVTIKITQCDRTPVSQQAHMHDQGLAKGVITWSVVGDDKK